MFRRHLLVAAAAMALAALSGGQAWADCQNKGTLTGTGVIPDATGTVEVKAQGTQQRIQVVADLAVADGTQFVVVTKSQSGPKILGTVVVEMGRGELKISNNKGKADPGATDPFCAIHSISILDATQQPVLSGTF